MKQPGAERTWHRLCRAAEEEVGQILRSLPGPARARAAGVPCTMEPRPSAELVQDGLGEDTLGLFVGEAYPYEFSSQDPLPRQIILYLANIWEFAQHDPATYREEVRRTYLHELGHYLGLDEDDLEQRDLD